MLIQINKLDPDNKEDPTMHTAAVEIKLTTKEFDTLAEQAGDAGDAGIIGYVSRLINVSPMANYEREYLDGEAEEQAKLLR